MVDPHTRKRYRSNTIYLNVALACALLLLTVPVLTVLRDNSEADEPARHLPEIEAAAGDRILGGTELGYRFAVPKGFVPVLNSQGADVALTPRKWQPVFAHLEITGIKMHESVEDLDDDALAEFALKVGDTNSSPTNATSVIDTATTADDSRVIWVDGERDQSTAYAYQDDRAIRIDVKPPDLDTDDSIADYDQETFPAATRALVSTLEFV